MTRRGTERYSFAEFTLDIAERRLCRRGVPVPLPPTAFDVLVTLVRHAGQLVSKRDLLASVWHDTFVEGEILTVYVSLLRKTLDDTARPSRFIQTVPRFGYRFVAPVVPFRAEKANEHVSRGRRHLLNGSCFALQQAVDAFQSAVRGDETDASAYAGFALARCAQAQNLAASPRRAYADATRAVLRALALDQNHPDAQVALGTVLLFREWDWVGAERAARLALEIDTEHVGAYVLYGDLLDARGHVDGGLEMKMRALEHAPLSPFMLTQIAMSFWRRRDYEQTIAWTQRALAEDATHVTARRYLAFALWKTRQYDAVTAELVTTAELFGVTNETLMRASAASHAPDVGSWPSPFTRVVMAHLPTAAGGPSRINAAVASGERREADTAFRHLDHVIARREPCLIHLGVDPQWDSLRGDPRFHQRLEHIGLARD